ncbi:hypothetical protein Tco_0513949 [Tanacetum coccineum]
MSNTNTNLQTQTSSVLHNDTLSSCLTSKVQEKIQLSKERCMKSLRAIQSQFKFLTYTLQDFGTMPIFKRTFSQDLDLLEQHLTKEIISQTDSKNYFGQNSEQRFENASIQNSKKRILLGDQQTVSAIHESKFTLRYAESNDNKYFVNNTGLRGKHFKDTLLQHMSNVKKSVAERTRHQRQYDRRVNKRQLQTQESKIDTGKAMDNGLVVMESNGIE